MTSDGAEKRVLGAIVESAGERRAIRTRLGVLLAAGGFESNEELRREYGVPGEARDTMGSCGSRGLALQAGIAAGADIDLMDQAWWSPGMTHPDGRSAFALWFTGGIFVNQNGDRFVNESRAYDRAGREIIAQLREGSITLPYWMIYDDKEGEVPPVKAANVTIVDTEKYVAAGLWHTADTLEELADKIGVPAGPLTATVARFNDFAAAGVDEDFGRGDEAFDRAFSGGALAVGAHRPAAVSRGRVRHLRPGHQGRTAHRHRGAGARRVRPTHSRPVRGRQHDGRAQR